VTDLKTLKDFNPELSSEMNGYGQAMQEIKQEAIKWIKVLEKSHRDWTESSSHGLNGSKEFDFLDYNEEEICEYIRHFFNITEEDLE
jgi:hypothetical protein